MGFAQVFTSPMCLITPLFSPPFFQGKNSPQRVQHRRDVEDPKRGKKSDNDGGGGDGGRAEMSTSGTGASSNLESQVLTAQKLTQRLGKSSVEEIFNKDDVLDVLRGVRKLSRCERSVWRDFPTLWCLLYSILVSNVSSLFSALVDGVRSI